MRRLRDGFKYNAKESFFGLKETDKDFDFRLNLSLKYGLVEPILFGKNLKTNELFGGPLIRLTKQIQASQGHDVVAIPHPRFSTYEDLTKVASELVLIFDDFKLAIKG